MKNLTNLLAVFTLVAMMGLLVGCGCGTTNTPAKEDMVGNTNEAVPPSGSTNGNTVNQGLQDDNGHPDTNNDMDQNSSSIVDDQGNLIDGNGTATDNGIGETDQTPDNTADNNNAATGDTGNVVGDVIDDAGNAISDVGRGVNNITDGTRR